MDITVSMAIVAIQTLQTLWTLQLVLTLKPIAVNTTTTVNRKMNAVTVV